MVCDDTILWTNTERNLHGLQGMKTRKKELTIVKQQNIWLLVSTADVALFLNL